MRVKFAMNKRYFVKRGKRVDLRSLVRNIPSSVTLMDDPEKDVQVQETQEVTSSAHAEQDPLNLDFDDVAGAVSRSSVQSNRNLNETVGGMNLLTSAANKVENYQLRTWIETRAEPVQPLVKFLQFPDVKDAAVQGKGQEFHWNVYSDVVTRGPYVKRSTSRGLCKF